MFPEIVIFGLKLYPYGMMIGIGVVFAILLSQKRYKAASYNEDQVFNMAMISIVSGIIGAKIFYIISNFSYLISNPLEIIKNFNEGFVFYGGIIFGIITAYIYIRKKGWPFFKTFDLAIPAIPLAQAFGRIGCFFAGCCYGKETNSFLSIEFQKSPFAPNGISLIPTQLISSFGNFLIFAFLMWFDKNKKKREGQTGAMYLIIYSIARFIIEFFRGDPRGNVSIFSTSQFICIFVFIIGIIMYNKVSKVSLDEIDSDFEDSEDVNTKDNVE